MLYRDYEHFLSQERMNRYLFACGYDKVKAKTLYRINLKLSKSFLPLFSLFEVGLRNVIHRELTAHFSDPDWILNQQNGFMISPSLGVKKMNGKVIPERYLHDEVEKAKQRLKRAAHKPPLTAGRVIAEQTFGFWTIMFDKRYFHTLKQVPLKAFPLAPAGTSETILMPRLRQIRDFRNRISHHEPVCFNRYGNSCPQAATDIRQLVYELSGWISPDFRACLSRADSGYTGIQLKRLKDLN
ncbi:MAG: Abi family protein [Bacteroidia bacterium]|jgi:hypothetical protein|nr:Abi family protein [Bacteroidia bacterium]